jgi:hypothetical protein
MQRIGTLSGHPFRKGESACACAELGARTKTGGASTAERCTASITVAAAFAAASTGGAVAAGTGSDAP